ncbi:MAG: c-type cytochrome [Candidatus Binatia bacterium]
MKTLYATLAALVVGGLVALTPGFSAAQDSKLLEQGRDVYDAYCVICHGDKGDGKGLIGIVHRAQQEGIVVNIYPRDFTAGMFKFRSTPTGSLPTDEDLLRTVTNGIPRSGMPSHKDVSLADRKAVIEYIKTFSQRWKEDKPAKPIKIGKAPRYVGSKESVARGGKVYNEYGCFQCHGKTGLGDGPSSATLEDNWGDKILPFDFTSGALKGGTEPEAVYKTFMTGLDGTPMPSYADSLNEQQRWDVVSYCLELMKGTQVAQK